MCWPVSIAPFEVIVVVANIQDDTQTSLAEGLYTDLLDQGIDVLLDDRSERAGVKFKDADLIGIPWRIVVGRDASEGLVELVRRATREVQKMPHAEVIGTLMGELRP